MVADEVGDACLSETVALGNKEFAKFKPAWG
jgi:hypothetical protein